MLKQITDFSRFTNMIGIIPNFVEIYSFNYDSKEIVCNLLNIDNDTGNIIKVMSGVVYIYAGENKNAPFTLSSSDIVNLRDNQ